MKHYLPNMKTIIMAARTTEIDTTATDVFPPAMVTPGSITSVIKSVITILSLIKLRCYTNIYV